VTGKIGFGGGCHWCTEAVFASLKGVLSVHQGWLASDGENSSFSEGVIVEYDNDFLSIEILVAIHVYTHSAASDHHMRSKYRSAIYYFSDEQVTPITQALQKLQQDFEKPLVTQVLPYNNFQQNIDEQLNYYFTDPERPFCRTYIDPKLRLLLEQFSSLIDTDKVSHLLKKN